MEDGKEHKEVELRSEELLEVMNKIPLWILRRGISLLFIIIVVILTGSSIFKYPDVIIVDMTLTGRNPVAQIVSRSSGKINSLYVSDGQGVKAKTVLAVIENPASIDDIMLLKQLLQKKKNPYDIINVIRDKASESEVASIGELSLGEIQSVYTSFLNSLNEYDNYYSLNFFTKKIKSVREQINKYRTYYGNQKSRLEVIAEQHKLSEQQFQRDSSLFAHGVISPSEYDNAFSAYLQSRYSLENGFATLENLLIQIGEMEITLLDMELQQAEKESNLNHSFNIATEQLINAVNSWELKYCLTTPIDGKMTFVKYWNENQFIQAGENVFTVVPEEKEEIIGKALLPVERSGKVKSGQRVIIRLANYPDQEYGIVAGIVRSISLVPQEGSFQIDISLPDELMTNYGKILPVTYEMKASADIITENRSLFERFFMPMKKILKEGLDNKTI